MTQNNWKTKEQWILHNILFHCLLVEQRRTLFGNCCVLWIRIHPGASFHRLFLLRRTITTASILFHLIAILIRPFNFKDRMWKHFPSTAMVLRCAKLCNGISNLRMFVNWFLAVLSEFFDCKFLHSQPSSRRELITKGNRIEEDQNKENNFCSVIGIPTMFIIRLGIKGCF